MAAKKTVEEKEFHVDEALGRLDEINQKLSDKDIELNEAIELYKEGVKIAALCKENLADVEKTLEIINA